MSTSDPYVKVLLRQVDGSSSEFKTKYIDGSLDPVYNESFEFESNVAQRTAESLSLIHI